MRVELFQESIPILLIYEHDRDKEGETLKQDLLKNGAAVATWKVLQNKVLRPGLPLNQEDILMQIAQHAESFVVIPSEELTHGQAALLIYACIEQAAIRNKPLIPVKFQEGDTGFVYLDVFSSVDFFPEDPQRREYQLQRLLWGLGLRGRPERC